MRIKKHKRKKKIIKKIKNIILLSTVLYVHLLPHETRLKFLLHICPFDYLIRQSKEDITSSVVVSLCSVSDFLCLI